MQETPWEKYKRQMVELGPMRETLEATEKKIDDELYAARDRCEHIDDFGACSLCGMYLN